MSEKFVLLVGQISRDDTNSWLILNYVVWSWCNLQHRSKYGYAGFADLL